MIEKTKVSNPMYVQVALAASVEQALIVGCSSLYSAKEDPLRQMDDLHPFVGPRESRLRIPYHPLSCKDVGSHVRLGNLCVDTPTPKSQVAFDLGKHIGMMSHPAK